MEHKKIHLRNEFEDAFQLIYRDIDLLASLASEADIFRKQENEIRKTRSRLKQSIKAIEYLTTFQE